MQKLENLLICFEFLKKEKIKIVNIGPQDILGGNMRLILGLIWTLILEYEIGHDGIDGLLAWVRSKIPKRDVKNWQKDWNDGRAVCALVDALCPGLCPGAEELNPEKKEENCRKGIDLAYNALQIDRLILPEEMAHPKVDKMAVLAYIAQFRNLTDDDLRKAKEYMTGKKVEAYLMSNAYGPGLVEGLKDTATKFFVEVPSSCTDELKILIKGPGDAEAKCSVSQDASGKYTVDYTPTVVGRYEIHVTLGGHHVPGSVFYVNVLAQESLGGEGLIRVFYSTTSSTDKGRADVKNLESLLVKKKVHLRKCFEPWHAVDIMDKADRDAVFRRANTRNLPIVFVNDEYIGDYDTLAALEEEGKLDKILMLSDEGMVSIEEHMKRLNALSE